MTLQERARTFNRTNPNPTMVYYLRRHSTKVGHRGTPYGVVVGVVKESGGLSIGYHKVYTGEVFNKQVGRFIATNRALVCDNPRTPGYDRMRDRLVRYTEKNATHQTNGVHESYAPVNQ